MLFEEAFEEFKEYAEKRHKKQCFCNLSQDFKKHVLPYFKGKNVQDITIQDVFLWQNNILDKNFSNSYNKNIYYSFTCFADFCLLNSYLNTNVVRNAKGFKRKIEKHDHKVYTLFEYLRFRKGLKNRVYRYFFDLLYFHGLRSGEAMALKFSDLRGKRLHIGKSIQRRGKRLLDSPKTANSDRFLCLGFILRLELFILSCFYQKKYGDDYFDYFIFGGKKPLSPTSIKRYKHYACLRSHIFEITTHEFRHSYATRMIKKGVSIDKVSKYLGHSSVSITLDVYVHNEKKDQSLLFSLEFFNNLSQIFKKFFKSIITRFIV